LQITQLTKDRELISKTLEQRDTELSEMRRELRKSKDSLAAEKLRARRATLLQSSPSPANSTGNVTAAMSSSNKSSSSILPVPSVTIPIPSTPMSGSGSRSTSSMSPLGAGRVSSLKANLLAPTSQNHSSKSTRTSLLRPPSTSSSSLLRSVNGAYAPSTGSISGVAGITSLSRKSSSRHSFGGGAFGLTSGITGSSSSSAVAGAGGSNSTTGSSTDASVYAIRDKCYQILLKHDPAKASRLDSIMDRFKGREHVLLDKVRNRYAESQVAPVLNMNNNNQHQSNDDGSNSDKWETDSVMSGASSVMTSPKLRSEMSIRKHKARMRRQTMGGGR
jgi:hypothetical protein